MEFKESNITGQYISKKDYDELQRLVQTIQSSFSDYKVAVHSLTVRVSILEKLLIQKNNLTEQELINEVQLIMDKLKQ